MTTPGPRRTMRLALALAGLLLASCGRGDPDGPPATREATAAVSTDVLAGCLPEKIGSWTRGGVRSHSQPSGDGELNWVTTHMESPNSENPITVELLDCAHAPTLLEAFKITFETRQPGYRKFAPDGHRAVEVYNRRPLNTNLEVMVADRFWLKVGGEGQDPLMMNEILGAFDLDRIAKLAQ